MTVQQTRAGDNTALVRRFIEEAWNTGNVGVVDELVAADFVDHPLWPNVVLSGPSELSPREQLKQDIAGFRTTLPDLHITIDELIDAGDKVVSVTTNRGTRYGDTPVEWREIIIDQVAD